MNYKNIVFITIIGGLFINPQLAISGDIRVSDHKKQECISIAKKVGAVVGVATVLATGGLGTYFYLRHRKKQQVIEALEDGNLEAFKKLAQSGFPIPLFFHGSENILHKILDQPALLRDEKMEEAVQFVVEDLKWYFDFNEPDTKGTTLLFKAMDNIVCFEKAPHYVDQSLNIIDYLIEYGADQNSKRTDNHSVTVCGVETKNGSLLHAAATIFDYGVRNKVIGHLIAKGVDVTLKDAFGRVYQGVIRKSSVYEEL